MLRRSMSTGDALALQRASEHARTGDNTPVQLRIAQECCHGKLLHQTVVRSCARGAARRPPQHHRDAQGHVYGALQTTSLSHELIDLRVAWQNKNI